MEVRRRRRLRGCTRGSDADGERDLRRVEGGGGGRGGEGGLMGASVGARVEPPGWDEGGNGRYSSSGSDSSASWSSSESVCSSESVRKAGVGGASATWDAARRRSMSLLVVTSTGGTCETGTPDRDDDGQAGRGQERTAGTESGPLDAGGRFWGARWDAQRVWPQRRVMGERRRAGGGQSGHWRRARRAWGSRGLWGSGRGFMAG